MRFRNDAGLWSPWELYATSKAWDLTLFSGSASTGTRTVEVQVRNAAGTIGAGNDTIFLYRPTTYFGSGCSGSMGVPTYVITGIPGLNRTITFQVGNTAAPLMIIEGGVSNTFWATLPLPLDLSGLNAAGCFLRVSLDAAIYSGGVAPIPVTLPNDPAIVEIPIYTQAFLFGDPSGKTLVSTRGARTEIANL